MGKDLKIINIITALVLFLFLSNCSGRHFDLNIKDETLLSKTGCIAVLPFKNLTDNHEAGSVIPELLISELGSRELFRIVPYSAVLDKVNSMNMGSELFTNSGAACKLANEVYAQGVITGIVTEYSYIGRGENFYEPRLGFSFSLYSSEGCKLLMTTRIAKIKSGLSVSRKDSLSALVMTSLKDFSEKFREKTGTRMLDFKYRCGMKPADKEDEVCRPQPNGWIDFEKCPDSLPELKLSSSGVSIEGDELILEESINFVPGKALVSPDSYGMLKELIEFSNDKGIGILRVESYIAGKEGSPDEDLSLDRAGSVRKYLIRNGLKAVKVDTINFVINPDLIKGKDIPSIRFVVVR